jgi:hypothetical protein
MAALLLPVLAAAILAVRGALRAILTSAAVHRRLLVFAVLLAASVFSFAASHPFRRVLALVLHVFATSASVFVLRLRSFGLGGRGLLRHKGQPGSQREHQHHRDRSNFHCITFFIF